MPELPEVETVRRGLETATLGALIVGGEVHLERTIAHPVSVGAFLAGLSHCAIAAWQRRGKYLLARLEVRDRPSGEKGGGWLGVHLRMTGQLLWLSPDEPLQKHTRVRLFLDGDRELRFVDTRSFGQMWWVPPQTPVEAIVSGLAQLGPEPLSADFSPDYLYEQLRRRHRPIKTALLDQGILAGLGNIYADESLFLAGILPMTPCNDLDRSQTQRLYESIVKVLQTAIAAGGTSFSTFLNLHGVNGNYTGVAWVYKRTGEPCRLCATAIERVKLAGRSTHFCPQCQGI